MSSLSRHFTKTFFAGIVALLPIGGLVLGAVFAEQSIANSWLADQVFYFPGLGIVAVVVITYVIGLTVSTLVGRLVWRLADRLLEQLPALGMLYRTLKQVLGYGEGEGALFERVVLVPGRDQASLEIGLVTSTLPARADGGPRLVVFVPAAPAPTSGRVVILEEKQVEATTMSVHDAMKFLVAIGKLEEGQTTALAS